MRVMDIEDWIQEYIITLYVLKILERDRNQAALWNLARFADELFGRLSDCIRSRYEAAKRQLRSRSCRIVSEEVQANRHVRVVYEYRGCGHCCDMSPAVLKSRCELMLKELLGQVL